MSEILKTPASKWREQGQADPHGRHYDCQRAALALGDYTDDELANAVFMHGDTRPPLADVIAGRAKMPIAYLTAAKDRIRWLSRSLEASTEREAALQQLLNAADQRIDELTTQHQAEPAAWSYKFGGEQRFYPRDPRGPEAGASASFMTDVEPLYRRPADQFRDVAKMIGIERMPPMEYDEP